MSKLETITIDTPSGSNTMQIGSTNTATINLGVSGDTINVPAGVTIANAGTATGFGGNNAPNFHAYNSANLDNSHNTYFLARFNTESFDTASAYTNTDGNYKFTVPSGQAGKYFFYTQLGFSNNVGTWMVQSLGYIRKNGVDQARMGINTNQAQGFQNNVVNTSIVLDLAVGDYVQVYAFGETGDANNVKLKGGQDQTFFGGFKLV